MDLSNISKLTPIHPYINEDGWYAQCHRCWTEIEPSDKVCPKCRQTQDWSWFGNYKNEKEKLI